MRMTLHAAALAFCMTACNVGDTDTDDNDENDARRPVEEQETLQDDPRSLSVCRPPTGAVKSLYTKRDCEGVEYATSNDETWDGQGCLSYFIWFGGITIRSTRRTDGVCNNRETPLTYLFGNRTVSRGL